MHKPMLCVQTATC